MIALLVVQSALAHPIGYSTVNLDVDRTGVDVVLDLHARTIVDVIPGADGDADRELSAKEAAALANSLRAYVPAHLALDVGGAPCRVALSGAPHLAGTERLVLTARARCDTTLADTLTVRADLLMEDEGGHTLLTRVRTPIDFHQLALVPDHVTATLPLQAAAPPAVLPPPPDDLPVGTTRATEPDSIWAWLSVAATLAAGLTGLMRRART